MGMRRRQPTNSGAKSWHIETWEGTGESGQRMEWTGPRGEKSDISGETKLTWANKIYKRIDQNFSRKFISINRYVHHYQGTDSPPVISLLIFVSPPSPSPPHPVMIGQKLQLRKAAFCLVRPAPSHINLFVSPPIIIYKT